MPFLWNCQILGEKVQIRLSREGRLNFECKGYAVLLLGQRWHYHDGLFRTIYNHLKLLYSFVGKIVIYFGQEKGWEAAKRNSFASWQCSSAQINDGSSHINAVWFQSSPSSDVFTRSSTIWLFPFPKSEKQHVKGQRFHSNEDVISAVEEWFESHPKSYYAQGLLRVKERWQKCVDMQGDYVEK